VEGLAGQSIGICFEKVGLGHVGALPVDWKSRAGERHPMTTAADASGKLGRLGKTVSPKIQSMFG
jgi:hypothetical protein